ncbi:MAG: hypothetical protein ACLP59_33545 [Bryobacteraceae bacterium]
MLAKFTLYDFIAVIIPGVFLLWAVGAITDLPELKTASLGANLVEASVFVVVAYVAGLILGAASEQFTEKLLLVIWNGYPSARWLLDDDQTLTPTYKADFWACLNKTFHIEPPSASASAPRAERMRENQEAFYRCYRSIEKLTEMPQVFNAQYGLYRSLLTAFVLLMLVAASNSASRLLTGAPVGREHVRALALLTIGTVASYWRAKKRGEDFARSVLDGFLASFGKG